MNTRGNISRLACVTVVILRVSEHHRSTYGRLMYVKYGLSPIEDAFEIQGWNLSFLVYHCAPIIYKPFLTKARSERALRGALQHQKVTSTWWYWHHQHFHVGYSRLALALGPNNTWTTYWVWIPAHCEFTMEFGWFSLLLEQTGCFFECGPYAVLAFLDSQPQFLYALSMIYVDKWN